MLLSVLAALALASSPAAARDTALTDILSGLGQVRGLKMMKEGAQYELPAGGAPRKGDLEDFLRRRTPDEIMKSGLSTGCGDYAFSFYHLLQAKGYEVLYVDAAALTFHSVVAHFDGHTAVAVKDKDSGNWILVDPTFDRIISGDWSRDAPLYSGPAGHFWIGYVGPLEKYPVKDQDALKKFYAETLAKVPKDVWEKELIRFDFTVDPGVKNPHVAEFIRRPDEIFKTLGAVPSRSVKVTLKDGGNEEKDDCAQNADGSWVCTVSRRAAMSAGMTSWMAGRILREAGDR